MSKRSTTDATLLEANDFLPLCEMVTMHMDVESPEMPLAKDVFTHKARADVLLPTGNFGFGCSSHDQDGNTRLKSTILMLRHNGGCCHLGQSVCLLTLTKCGLIAMRGVFYNFLSLV